MCSCDLICAWHRMQEAYLKQEMSQCTFSPDVHGSTEQIGRSGNVVQRSMEWLRRHLSLHLLLPCLPSFTPKHRRDTTREQSRRMADEEEMSHSTIGSYPL